MVRNAYRNLARIRERANGKTIVFSSGTFDLTHAGHALFLADCKQLGDILVVAVGPDADAREKGPDRPILNEHVRLHMVRALKPVDYAFTNKPAQGNNERFLGEVFKILKPDIYALNSDISDLPHRGRAAKKHGVKVVVLERSCPPEFERISTTNLIEKIKNLG